MARSFRCRPVIPSNEADVPTPSVLPVALGSGKEHSAHFIDAKTEARGAKPRGEWMMAALPRTEPGRHGTSCTGGWLWPQVLFPPQPTEDRKVLAARVLTVIWGRVLNTWYRDWRRRLAHSSS